MVGASIKDGWAAFNRSAWTMVGALFLVGIVNGLVGGIGNGLMDDGKATTASGLWSVLGWLATFPLAAGMSFLMLRLVRGEPGAGIETLIAGYRRYLALLGAWILMCVIVVIGFVLLIVPGIVASLGLAQAPMLVLDKGLGPVDALKASWAMMRGYKIDAFLLGLACAAIVLAGALALLVGLIVAVPVVSAAGAAFYDRVLAANPPPQLADASSGALAAT